jgi:hypothetical protein
LRTFWRILA